MKSRIKQHLSITKKEWNGLVVLVILIAGVLAAPYGYRLFRKDNTINFKDFDKAAAQLSSVEKNGTIGDGDPGTDVKITNPVMFPFDPNVLTVPQWKQLGLSGRQANVILHYRAKGGHFYVKEDVKKIYAVTADDYKRLEPYINIPEGNKGYKKAKPGEVIELNGADSAKLTALEGIGPSFAVRIIRYRNRLGGFVNKEQLKEIYGIDSLEFADIKNQVSVNADKVKKININTISFDQLRIFPYLNYKQLNAIIQYRAQHGSYNSIADLRNIVLLDEGILRKIEPYLAFK
ncbi:helix-hairpin-helix domain-containing protein [Mucilaginibacter gotjawali]|nr:helix-hairpin-helix domain-containing protein [Mucilaginibacter gotjawali]MBB3057435.1 DNA uptake protein ComE-like DNA-binding protein [Mucilaginibacter gotjawali]